MRTSAAEPGCTSAPWMSTTPGSSVGARPRMESPRSNRLVEQVMTRPPYNDAIHAPIHASWLNQVEIYFSNRATKGPHAERLQRSGYRRGPTARFSILLGSDRAAIRMDV